MKWKVGQQPLEERGCGGLTCRVMLCRVSLRSERTVYIYACYIFDRVGKKLGSAENTQPALVFFFFFSPMWTQTPDVIADWFPLAPQGTHASSNTPTHRHAKKIIPCMLVSSKGQNSTDGSTNPFPCVKEGDSATASCKLHCQTTSNQTSRSPACLSTHWLIWKTWLECFGYGICLAVHMFEGLCSTEWIFTCAAGSKWHRRASHYEPLLTVIRWLDEILKNADALAGSGASSVAYILERWHIGAAAGQPAGRPAGSPCSSRAPDSRSFPSRCAYFHSASWPQLKRCHSYRRFLSERNWVSLEKTSWRSICLTCRAKNRRGVCTGAIFGGLFFLFNLLNITLLNSVKENRNDDKKEREKMLQMF